MPWRAATSCSRRMRDEGFITAEQEQAARRARLRVRPYPSAEIAQAGYAKDYLRQLFRDQFGGDHPPEWEVRTTFVPDLQEMAERAVSEGLRRFGDPDLQAALVAIDPRTGDILAMVGGRDFRLSQFNRASRSRRQPGSAFKPLLYAAALEHGFSPVSVLSDLGHVPPQGPDEWSPRNAEADAPDTLTLRAALLESDNRAATMLQQRIGSRPVLQAGVRRRPARHAGRAVAVARDRPRHAAGSHRRVRGVSRTAAWRSSRAASSASLDADGSAALENPVRSERVISPQTAFQMVSMLGDVIDRGTGSAARTQGVRFAVGGKTGTTNEFKDAWFVGFSSAVVVGVWVGFDQPKPIGREAYGVRYALPIWSDFMRRAARLRVPHEFETAGRAREEPLCRISYLSRSKAARSTTSTSRRGTRCRRGSARFTRARVKQRVQRAVKGFLSGLGKRILEGDIPVGGVQLPACQLPAKRRPQSLEVYLPDSPLRVRRFRPTPPEAWRRLVGRKQWRSFGFQLGCGSQTSLGWKLEAEVEAGSLDESWRSRKLLDCRRGSIEPCSRPGRSWTGDTRFSRLSPKAGWARSIAPAARCSATKSRSRSSSRISAVSGARERFMRESRACARLRHPHIVSILDFNIEPDGHPFLVMELLNGRSLKEELAESGRFSVDDVRRIVPPLCGALQFAHGLGIVHRDLKPANIVAHEFTPGERVYKLVDFGLANIRESSVGRPPDRACTSSSERSRTPRRSSCRRRSSTRVPTSTASAPWCSRC